MAPLPLTMIISVHLSSFDVSIISRWILASRMTKRLSAISEKYPSNKSPPVHPSVTRSLLVVPTSKLYLLIALPAHTKDQEINWIWLRILTFTRDWEECLYSCNPGFCAGGGAPVLNYRFTLLLSSLLALLLHAFAQNSNRNSLKG